VDKTFWLDNLLAACTALSAVVLAYSAWLLFVHLRERLSRRQQKPEEV